MKDDKTCSHCEGELGSRYYQDVPKEGDLCLPCHVLWVDKMKRALKGEENRDPDGDTSVALQDYTVEKRVVFTQSVSVAAHTPEEALRLVQVGKGVINDEEYSYDLPVDSWDVFDNIGNRVTEGE